MNIPLHELKRMMEAIPVLQAAREAAHEAKWAMRCRSNVNKTCEESVAAEDASDSAFDALRDAEADLAEAAVNALPSLLAVVQAAQANMDSEDAISAWIENGGTNGIDLIEIRHARAERLRRAIAPFQGEGGTMSLTTEGGGWIECGTRMPTGYDNWVLAWHPEWPRVRLVNWCNARVDSGHWRNEADDICHFHPMPTHWKEPTPPPSRDGG